MMIPLRIFGILYFALRIAFDGVMQAIAAGLKTCGVLKSLRIGFNPIGAQSLGTRACANARVR